MTCEHLDPLEKELIRSGMKETFRGRSWSRNCREFVCFDCTSGSESGCSVFA